MADAVSKSAEGGTSTMKSVETQKLIVRQPAKLKELTSLLETFENLNARVSERTGEDTSGDLGGAGSGAAGGQGSQGGTAGDQSTKRIPAPKVMRQKLTQHIERESKQLQKLAVSLANSSEPGAAFKLNEVFAKIRRLNALIRDIIEATLEVLERLYVRVFIEKQSIL